ncbi:precorrin-3B C(17)-methyltransferase [uncultured Ruminococcus sp.]|uniref:precorrin-3B C(17)-methyltransferase n=1 Tax=uncultured Ruminococcus sp. TaxID=165186 RepID=UPI002637C929|nr:precorrin-3B C(17)-methyltransferase [uncultured Ruminococcus sp.]
MKLYVVGIGCGSSGGMTVEARQAVENSDIIVGYTVYTRQIKAIFPEKKCLSTGMRQERDRVELALRLASEGRTVSLVCSGDSQLYGMAGLALELSQNYPDADIEVVAGVSAAFSGGAVLGSPMTHDLAIISLSDLLTPMEKIVKRLRCAAEGDFVIALYNPSSKKRADYLMKACDIILGFRSAETVCGYVRNIGREGQESRILTLGELRDTPVDMFTTVFIGNSETVIIGGKMVTPRGYRDV